MMLRNLLLSICIFGITSCIQGQLVSGNVQGEDGVLLPFASVYLKNSTYGVSTDSRGNYQIELASGESELVFSFIGYESTSRKLNIQEGNQVVNVVLKRISEELAAAEIVADTKARAKSIMELVRQNRRQYRQNIGSWEGNYYSKITLDQDSIILRTEALDLEQYANETPDSLKRGLLLKEYFGKAYGAKPNKYKQEVQAYRDYQDRMIPFIGKSMTLSFDLDRDELAALPRRATDPFLIYRGMQDATFDFYDNLMDFEGMVVKPILSPIAATSNLSYRYDFTGVFEENGRKIHQVYCTPLFRNEALFEGTLFIEDETWALVGVDLEINPNALTVCERFRIIQNYTELETGVYAVSRQDVQYTVKDGKNLVLGRTETIFSELVANKKYKLGFFDGEVLRFELDAGEKSEEFWDERRPITLNDSERNFIQHSDSIDNYLGSDEYFRQIDSAFNKINWYTPLAGIGHRNREKGREWYIGGILEQINPLGIGGYRHKLPGYIHQIMPNDTKLEVDGFIDYGFKNNDVKGSVGVGWTWDPSRSVRSYLKVGDYYEMVNQYASIEQIFSRSNFIRTRKIYGNQRMELINGLYAEIGFEYSDQQPLFGLTFANWSNELFGELNRPADFERYTKSEVQFELLYRIKQKYVWKRGNKEVLGTDHPTLNLKYRKGIPTLFNSETDYDLIEVGAEHDANLARFGKIHWKVMAGSFVNKRNLRLLEHRYFRGSDQFFFSDPTFSFQLLGPTLSTPDAFFQANVMHHFNGTILGKVPLLNRLKLQLAGGGGLLLLDEENFRHAEVFAGLERVFNIKEELFRVGVYAVTSDNSLSSPVFTFKVGLNFYNTFTREWDY